MTEAVLSSSLREAVDEVLETMFFVESDGQAIQGRPPEELFTAQVDFEGSPPGILRMRISRAAAQQMAADFLGEESAELPAGRTVEVVLELANMICGAVLSRVESETTFRLSPPTASVEVGPIAELSAGAAGVCYFELPGGALSVTLLEAAAA